jgi:iron complex transport system ATP-binding protein
MNCAVACRDLVAGYRDRPVLEHVTLTVPVGQMLALLGPNGAGKSTLLRVWTGLHAPRAGTVELFGRDLRQISPAERARLVAVVPQEVTTPMSFTVAELVALGRRQWAQLDAHDRQVVEAALAYTDTLELRDRFYSELSGGEKQRAILALALAQEPQLLLLDEPTAHLDINHRLEVLQLLERLNRERGLTVVMTSHDLNLAAEFFPQLALLDRGRLVATGTAREVLREDRLADVYRCQLTVRADPSGSVIVLPSRAAPAPTGQRAHVIGGGGSAGEILRRLCLAGWRVSAGALNQGDSDAVAATALGLEVALEKPFSPLSPDALAQAGKLAASADVVIVTEVPFGAGNVRNLEVARQAGKPVWINTRQLAARDFTPGHEAQTLVRALLDAGATPWEHVGDLLARLEKPQCNPPSASA